ncbi:MAG: hypothetical protein ACLGI6_15990 [Gammaproteobacteria bacterium]
MKNVLPWSHVPPAVWALLAAALAAQLAWRGAAPSAPAPIGAPLPTAVLRAASLGEPVALARALALLLHAREDRQPLRQLDYTALRAWLERMLDLDPRGQAPLLAASQVYAAVQDPARVRIMLDLVARRFGDDPDRRWPWLAQAALVAQHRLHDAALARTYAAALRSRTAPGVLPAWAQQLEVFILEASNETEAERLLIGAMLANGQVRDPNEARLLEQRLHALE